MSEDVKNVPLYNALVRRFEDVQVSGRGDEADVEVIPVASALARSAGHRDQVNAKGGEYYTVNCPFCDDSQVKRHRLWISYLYGRDISCEGAVVQATRHLAICYNENCLSDGDNRWNLWNMIRDSMVDDDQTPFECAAASAPREVTEADLPEGCVSVRSPKCPKMVVDYLLEREVDLDEAARVYGLMAGHIQMYAPYPCVIIPIRMNGEFKGWQARQVRKHPEGAPKYYFPNSVKKAWLLYNRDIASLSDFVILTEGVFDAIRCGGPCCAMFGKSPSIRQRELILQMWRRIVWLPDVSDEQSVEAARKHTGEWMARGLVDSADVVLLPGDDPGSTPRDVIWAAMAEHFNRKDQE